VADTKSSRHRGAAELIDTEMASGYDQPKTPPRHVAERTLEGIRPGQDHVLADSIAEEMSRATRSEPAQSAATMQQARIKEFPSASPFIGPRLP
jgi:hypothetical protein